MKTVWDEFAPWFDSKTLHIGADEYPANQASQFRLYVNTMARYIWEKHGKLPQAWGTTSNNYPLPKVNGTFTYIDNREGEHLNRFCENICEGSGVSVVLTIRLDDIAAIGGGRALVYRRRYER